MKAINVGGETGHQTADRVLVEEAQPETTHMPEKRDPQISQRPQADPLEKVELRRFSEEPEQYGHQKEEHDEVKPFENPGGEVIVDGDL